MTRWKSLPLSTAIVLMAGFASNACGNAGDDAERSETTAHTHEALTQTFELPVPVGFNPQDIVIGATNVVNINDVANITSDVPNPLSPTWGNIAAFGPTTGTTNLGVKTQVGVVWSRTSLLLRGGTLAFYKALGSVTPQAGTSFRQPQENSDGVNIRQDLAWTVAITAPDSGTPITVNAGQTSPLGAGNYGHVIVNSQGTLVLTGSGDYGFRSLNIQSGATIQLTASTAPRIFVRDSLAIRAPVLKPGLILGYLGTSTAFIEAGGRFQGDLFLARNASIEIKGNSVGHFFARNVTVFEGVQVRGPVLSQASQGYIRPSSAFRRPGLISSTGAAEIASALLPTGSGCAEPRAFVSYSGASMFHGPVSTIGSPSAVVQDAVLPVAAPPAGCIGAPLTGWDHNRYDKDVPPEPDPPLWTIQPGGRPFYSHADVGLDSLATRLTGGRVVQAGFAQRLCEDPSAGLPRGAGCPATQPAMESSCDYLANPGPCVYPPPPPATLGGNYCLCAPACTPGGGPCTSGTECCSNSCTLGSCVAPSTAGGNWKCGPLNRVEAGAVGVRMSTDCGTTWTAGAFDALALGQPVTTNTIDRPEMFWDSHDSKLYVSGNTWNAFGFGNATAVYQSVYSASTSGITNASNLVWQAVRAPEAWDSGPKPMTTVVDEGARLNTNPVTFGRYVHFVSARCTGDINGDSRPDVAIDLETPFGRKQWALVEGDSDPSTICNKVNRGSSAQPFEGGMEGPSIVGVSSTPPRLLVAYTGVSNTTPEYTIINVYSVTIRNANGYSVRPVVERVLRVDGSGQGQHSVWPQLIAPDGLGNSSMLFDMPVVLRWSRIQSPNVAEMAQVLYSGMLGAQHLIELWSIANTFPGTDCVAVGCFVGDYKYGAFYQKAGGTLSYFTPWTGGGRDPATNNAIQYPTANGAFIDVTP